MSRWGSLEVKYFFSHYSGSFVLNCVEAFEKQFSHQQCLGFRLLYTHVVLTHTMKERGAKVSKVETKTAIQTNQLLGTWLKPWLVQVGRMKWWRFSRTAACLSPAGAIKSWRSWRRMACATDKALSPRWCWSIPKTEVGNLCLWLMSTAKELQWHRLVFQWPR